MDSGSGTRAEDVAGLLARYPFDELTQDTLAHFRGRLSHQFLVATCEGCGFMHHPCRGLCPACWSRELGALPISGRGTVVLLTRLYSGPDVKGVDYSSGYWVAAIELVEQAGLRVVAGVVGSDVTIGSRVELFWTDRDGDPTPAFRVVHEGPGVPR